MPFFNDSCTIIEFLEKAGYTVTPPKEEIHFLIIGAYVGRPMRCTWERLDVLMEEPEATFKQVDQNDCPFCNE